MSIQDYEIQFSCSVNGQETVQLLVSDDGEVGILINDADGVCVGEVCLSQSDSEALSDWLNMHLEKPQ